MIIINNELALRVKCEPVLTEEIGLLVETLEKELNYSNKLGKNGIGLAAPQIGIAKDIAIIRMNKININLINAKLEKGYDSSIFRDESCLSFPNRVENTMRYQEVVISNSIWPYNFIATGLVAVVCQHELDHLNSTLFMDHAISKPNTFINKNKIGPNDLCFCGSNKKYKKCCRS